MVEVSTAVETHFFDMRIDKQTGKHMITRLMTDLGISFAPVLSNTVTGPDCRRGTAK